MMPNPKAESDHDKIDLVQIASLVLSVYILGALVVETVVPLSIETVGLLDKIDFFICIFFLYDFFIRLFRSKSKKEFLRWGWIDFISSIPVFPAFQWARLARVVRIIRLLRAFRSAKILIGYLFRHRARGVFSTAALISTVMMIFSSIAILNVEKAPTSNIRNPEDAIWWAFTTMTTDGYGDKYPITTGGRLIAAALMISSVCLFGVFTGFVTSYFVADDSKKDEVNIRQLVEEVRQLRLAVEASNLPTQPRRPKTEISALGENPPG